MRYRKDRKGRDISVLGYGCMRFTGKGPVIDRDKAAEEIRTAIERGVNYFDTAYVYPGSEAALGDILERLGMRDRVYIATKLPHYKVMKHSDLDRILNEELKRLRTDHIDYYLLHMLNDVKSFDRLKALGIEEWIREKTESGIIRNIGFSYHGNPDMFMRLIDSYDWDMCQIQYNYLDESSQAGRTGLKYAASKGIPVVIMEPLRGGRLAKLPLEAGKLMETYPVRRTPAEWALRWLWDQDEVTCVLSGMNSLEMVNENIDTACAAGPGELTEDDRALLEKAAAIINRNMKVPCTGCRYCMPCAHGVDIPGIFSAYNAYYCESRFLGFKLYYMCTALRKSGTGTLSCAGCGICETHCPQGIEIRKELKKAGRLFENPIYRLFVKAAKLVMHY